MQFLKRLFGRKPAVSNLSYNSGIKRIAVLGGSFNPPHLGHIEICRYLLKTNRADEILAVPCYQHPFGKKLAPFKDRLNMCRFAFQEFKDKVKISDIEEKLGGVSYTVRTLSYLNEKNPNDQFILVIGGDVEGETTDWNSMDEIMGLARMLMVPRGPNSFIPDISSSNVRENIRTGKPFMDMVTSEVAIYIVTHGLYHD